MPQEELKASICRSLIYSILLFAQLLAYSEPLSLFFVVPLTSCSFPNTAIVNLVNCIVPPCSVEVVNLFCPYNTLLHVVAITTSHFKHHGEHRKAVNLIICIFPTHLFYSSIVFPFLTGPSLHYTISLDLSLIRFCALLLAASCRHVPIFLLLCRSAVPTLCSFSLLFLTSTVDLIFLGRDYFYVHNPSLV